MRHTVTFEPDVEQAVKRLARKRDLPFKAIVNELLRLGISAAEDTRKNPPLVLTPVKLGWRGDLPPMWMLDDMEDEERFRNTSS